MTNRRADFIFSSDKDEKKMIENIIKMYNFGNPFELDPTFSVGRFWKGLVEPKLKYDLEPEREDVRQSDCTNLFELKDSSIKSIMFDPPFIVGKSKTGIISKRFSAFDTVPQLKEMYLKSLIEFYRILEKDGLLVIKCQDMISGGRFIITHVDVINRAEEIGYKCHDIFILTRDSVILSGKYTEQEHSRKNHSYFLVFSKGNKNPAKNKKSE